jgi:hypothetical protein
MKKFSSPLILLMAALIHSVATGPETLGQQDDLFSTVRTSTVFSGDVASSGPSGTVAETGRITSADDLVRMLQQAEFTATAVGTRAASTTKQLDSWQFPVLVTISDNEQDLLLVVGLRSVSDAQKLSTSRLLQLLELNQKAGRANFVFNRERGRIELLSFVKNSNQKAISLRDEINRLAILARDTETLWNLDEASGGAPLATAGSPQTQATKSTATPTTPQVDTAAPTTSSPPATVESPVPNLAVRTLQGRWAASRSATDAFALQLNSNATFVLVSVTNGRQSRATGKFTLQNNQLTLEGSDGIRLVAAVKLLSAAEFQFLQQTAGKSAAPLSFRKAP